MTFGMDTPSPLLCIRARIRPDQLAVARRPSRLVTRGPRMQPRINMTFPCLERQHLLDLRLLAHQRGTGSAGLAGLLAGGGISGGSRAQTFPGASRRP